MQRDIALEASIVGKYAAIVPVLDERARPTNDQVGKLISIKLLSATAVSVERLPQVNAWHGVNFSNSSQAGFA